MEIKPFEEKVWLSSPTMHGDEQKWVDNAILTNWVSTVGANINEVERMTAEKIGRKYAVALSSTDKGQAILTLVIFCAVLIALLYCFFGTEFGAAMRATGNNPKMSRAQGINTEKFKVIGLMLSNGIVALSGALLMQYQSAAEINMGRGAIVIGLAAVIIGEVVFGRIAKNFAVRLGGVVSGGIIYYIVYQVVVFCGIDTDLLKMLSAIVVATFLAVPHLKKKFTKPKIKRAESGVSGDA